MNTAKKIVSVQALKKIIRQSQRKGVEVAFTNGCFDILHAGHVHYLEAARTKNRLLIVGLNSDASVRRIKGPRRPVMGEKDRARILAALGCVDYVVIFGEDTPARLIATLKPDVLIKGSDWRGKKIVGREWVEKNGGRVELIRYQPGHSSTNIIQTILAKCKT